MEDDGDVKIQDIEETIKDNVDVVDVDNDKPLTHTDTHHQRGIEDEDEVTIVDSADSPQSGLNVLSPTPFTNEDILENSTTLVSLLLVHCISKVQHYKQQNAVENGGDADSTTLIATIEWNIVYELFIYQAKRLNQISPFHISNSDLNVIQSPSKCKQYYQSLISIYKDEKNLESLIRKSIIDNLKTSVNQLTLDDISKLKNEIKALNEEIGTLEEENEREREKEKEATTPFSPPQNITNIEEKDRSVPPSPIINQQDTTITSTPNIDDEAKKKEEEAIKARRSVMQSLQKVWKSINSHKYAEVFRYPITKDEAPDYDRIIKHRMDLSTLKKNLDKDLYQTGADFNVDLQLIFSNAMEYNEQGSEVYSMASTLKKFADKEIEIVLTTELMMSNPQGTTTRHRATTSTQTTPLPSPSVRGRKSIKPSTSKEPLSPPSSATPITTPTLSEDNPFSEDNTHPSSPSNNTAQSPSASPLSTSSSSSSSKGDEKVVPTTRRSARLSKASGNTTPTNSSVPQELKKVSKRQKTAKNEEKTTLSSDES